MANETKKNPPRIWSFGCLKPNDDHQQNTLMVLLRLAHEYQKKLVQIELTRRNEFRAIRSQNKNIIELESDVQSLENKIEELRAEIRKIRQSKRKRVNAPTSLQTQLKGLIEQVKHKREELKAERANYKASISAPDDYLKKTIVKRAGENAGPRTIEKVRKEVLEEMFASDEWSEEWKKIAKINQNSTEAVKQARANCGLPAGTYMLVERAFEASKNSQTDPKEPFWKMGGRIGVQLRRESIADVMSGKSAMLQIDPLPSNQWDTRSGRRHAHTKVRIRIGAEGNKPVWLEFPLLLDRPLPSDAIITWAWVLARREGLKIKYKLQLTFESSVFIREPKPLSAGVVAIDIGWRVFDDGIRAGYCVDDKGNEKELKLPTSIRERLAYADQLRSINDKHFNTAKSFLMWNSNLIPKELSDEIKFIYQWNSSKRLSKFSFNLSNNLNINVWSLWSKWKRERLAEQKDLFALPHEIVSWFISNGVSNELHLLSLYLEWWRIKNRHLYTWEINQRQKAMRARKNIYSIWAKELSNKYGTIVFEKFDLREMAKNAKDEQDLDTEFTHRIRKDVAPSELRQAFITRAGKECVQYVASEYSTREHSKCGYVNSWDHQEVLVQKCAGCSAEFDQDQNAAHVLLARWFESFGGGETTGSPRSGSKKAKRNEKSSGGMNEAVI